VKVTEGIDRIDPPYYTRPMAMGRRTREQQAAIWVAVSDLPRSVSHPFYEKLNQLLAEQGFDDFVETQCRPFYADRMGRPSLIPGLYFRLLLLGYFEGLDSERGIAWRAADSLGVRAFLGLALTEAAPDHSTISRTPTRADLAKLDRKRKKKGSNQDWTHPHDPDARITKMKDGRTHLAHKAEHAVDLETGAIVAVTLHGADQGDTTTIQTTLPDAVEQLEAVAAVTEDVVRTGEELVADKGYHSKQTVLDVQTLGVRTYISEPDRGPQQWIDQHAERDAVYANRRRIQGDRGRRLMRRRGELLERPNAHRYDTGGMRRTHLRKHGNILKRVLVHASACNLGLWMRTLTGVGTPRGLQGRLAAALALWIALWVLVRDRVTAYRHHGVDLRPLTILSHRVAAVTSLI